MRRIFILSILTAVSGIVSASIRQPSSACAKARADNAVNRHPPALKLRRTMPSTIDRQQFYKAMKENDKTLVNAQISELKSASGEGYEAFLGTLLMKKASFGGSPASKLKLFKEGRRMLEAAIKKDPENAEYHFLRLIVQEHAPGALGYKNDVQKDSEYIRKSYKSLPDDVQQAISDYSKKSKVLKLDLS